MTNEDIFLAGFEDGLGKNAFLLNAALPGYVGYKNAKRGGGTASSVGKGAAIGALTTGGAAGLLTRNKRFATAAGLAGGAAGGLSAAIGSRMGASARRDKQKLLREIRKSRR